MENLICNFVAARISGQLDHHHNPYHQVECLTLCHPDQSVWSLASQSQSSYLFSKSSPTWSPWFIHHNCYRILWLLKHPGHPTHHGQFDLLAIMAIKVLLVTLINSHREATVYFTLAVISGFLISCSCILGKFLNSRFVHIDRSLLYIFCYFYAIFCKEIL